MNRSSFNNKTGLGFVLAVLMAFAGLFATLMPSPANAQFLARTGGDANTVKSQTSTPAPRPAHFGVEFNGNAVSAAANLANAMRGPGDIRGKVLQELAETQSGTDDTATIGMDVRVTGFQPGSNCEADCNSSRAVIEAKGRSSAFGLSQHYMRTEGVDGGPASASSYGGSASNAAIGANGVVKWIGAPNSATPAVAPAKTGGKG